MSSFIPPPYLPLIIILIIINVGLAILCLYKIIKNIKLSKIQKYSWSLVIFFFCFIGPIAYMISNRKKEV
ncbi:MAG: PLDc N-terminal domain-containing protein [Promethearchaeota archaeon]|nr:MAG: PLDc N-terminal domain-containing protein [Candidatus Lokiarchaeota archaeon]